MPTVVLETIAVVIGVTALLKILRDKLEPSEESMKEIKKAKKLIKYFTYDTFEENYLCRGYKDIAENDFDAFLDEFQKRYKLEERTIKGIRDIMRSGEDQGHESEFKFKSGKGSMCCEHVYAIKKDLKISFAIARYTLSFKLKTMLQESLLLGLIPIKVKKCSDKESLTMSEQQKEMFRKVCEGKLFEHVVKKCNNPKIEPTPTTDSN